MGIYDRSYMDGTEDSRYGSAGERRFSAVAILVGINVVVWLLWQFARTNPELGRFLVDHFTVSPYGVLKEYRFHTLITANFSHEDLFHIFFNMLFFWFLAQEVELRYGRRNLYWVYFFCSVLTGLGYITVDLLKSQMFQIGVVPALGASGCVMGVGVIAAFLDPDRPIHFMGFIPIKLKWLISVYILFDILGMVGSRSGVAHAGHLGGALAGFLFYWFDLRLFGSGGRASAGILHTIKGWFRRKPKLRLVEKRPRDDEDFETQPVTTSTRPRQAGASPAGAAIDAETSRRVDELLDKISRGGGMDALTAEEREFLEASSQKYKRKS